MGNQTDLVVLLTSLDAEHAEAFAKRLVDERIAACVTLTAVRSTYRWDGEVASHAEQLAVIKTTKAGAQTLRSRLFELHPYDVPELLEIEVADGNPAYLNWVTAEVGG